MALSDDLLLLTKQLYPPDARAFKMPPDSVFEQLHIALNLSEERALTDAMSILDSIIPDNDNFTEDDATQWETRLAIIGNSTIPLANRKLSILQKMAYPGLDNPPRQSRSFLEQQLRSAGYDVYVYENIFLPGPVTKTPGEVLGVSAGLAVYGSVSYRETEYGGTWADDGITVVANYIEESKDASFAIGSNYRSTFFISGDPITTFANVDINRKDNFRQLILGLKPLQTVAFLFINYI